MTGTLQPIPSKPPAIEGNLGAAFEWIFKKLLQKTDGQLPAEIVSYNRSKNTATVRPLISIIATDGSRITRAPVASVPVLALGGGGWFVNFPLGAGDTGWIEASDRDISLYIQNAAISPPNSKRMHSFEDARFVPDVYAKYTFAPADGAMVISSLDGSTRIQLSAGTANIIAPTVTQQCATLNVEASDTVNITTGAFNVNTGTLSINTTGSGGTGITGEVILPTTTIIGGVAFPTHEHSGVQTGPGNTGGVVGLS